MGGRVARGARPGAPERAGLGLLCRSLAPGTANSCQAPAVSQVQQTPVLMKLDTSEFIYDI